MISQKKVKISPEIMRAALKADAKKRTREKSLKRNLRSWHLSIVRNFSSSIQGNLPTIELTQQEQIALDKLLSNHYIRTANDFSPINFKQYLKKNVNQLTIDQTKQTIIATILALIESNKDIRIDSIIETTEKLKSKALQSADIALQELQREQEIFKPLSNIERAKTTANILNNSLRKRESSLSISETTWIAEGTRQKHVEIVAPILAQVLNDEQTQLLLNNIEQSENYAEIAVALAILTESQAAQDAARTAQEAVKPENVEDQSFANSRLPLAIVAVIESFQAWVTMGDGKVRSSHKAANGQQVKVGQPFIVGGYLIQYPGDSSLGAPIEETAGCRCYIYYL